MTERKEAIVSQADIKSQQKSRSGLLDCIRAVAISMVVFFHVAVKYPGTEGIAEGFFQANGSKGVDIFFPLSGFLITSFLLQSTRPDFIKVFFLRRVFRILPLYFAMVTLAGIGIYVTGIDLHQLDKIWINYTFLTAWFIHFQGIDAVPYTITWSLSVEEFAYIIFGLSALVYRKALPAVLIVLAILPLFLKYWYVTQGHGYYFLPPARIDSIAIGGLTAWLMISGKRPLLWIGAALVVCYVLSAQSPELLATLFLNTLALWVCALMVIIQKWAKDFSNPVIAVGANIGFYSYFTYLFHVFVIEAVFIVLFRVGSFPPFEVVAVACLVMSHLAAILSYRWFEGPVMRWGRRLEGNIPAPEAALPEAASHTTPPTKS